MAGEKIRGRKKSPDLPSPPRRSEARRRRVKGTGSIFRHKARKCWAAKLPSGRKPDGKLRYKWFFGPTAEDVATQMRDYAPPAKSSTLAEWSGRWLESLGIRAQSRDNYEINLRLRILPELGGTPVRDITPFHVEEAHRKWGKAVGATTVRHTLATLGACLRAAARAGLCGADAVRLARKPPAEPAKPDPFSPGEVSAILGAALADPELHPLALCAACGLRVGEAMALRPGDYDPAAGLLTISRTASRGARGRPRGTNPPKSRNSARTIRVPLPARGAFAAPFRPASYRTLNRRWDELLARLGIRRRGFHQLRHSWATHRVARGASIADCAKYLGDTVAVFTKTYVHAAGEDVACDFEAMYAEAVGLQLGGAESGEPRKTKLRVAK